MRFLRRLAPLVARGRADRFSGMQTGVFTQLIERNANGVE